MTPYGTSRTSANRAWAYFSSSNVLAEASASIRFGPLGRVPPEDIDYNVFEVFLQSVGPGSVVLEIAPARDCTCAAITSLRDGLGSRVSSRESIARISSMVALKSRSEPSCAQVRSTLPRALRTRILHRRYLDVGRSEIGRAASTLIGAAHSDPNISCGRVRFQSPFRSSLT